MRVLIGKFDREITLYSPTFATDSNTGARAATYAAGTTIWVNVNARANAESFIDNKREDVRQVTLDARYEDASSITTKYQFDYNSLRYQVTSVEEAPDFERRTVIRITATSKL